MSVRSRRGRSVVGLGLVLYALLLALSPALHHDFECHATHPRHCDACRATTAASDPDPQSQPSISAPEASGVVEPPVLGAGGRTAFGRALGRAPPPTA